MEEETIINILKKWNPWEKEIEAGILRPKYLNTIYSSMRGKEILVLQGVRRSGKSTLLKQIIQKLLNDGKKKEQILFINFEDYNFANHLDLTLLEEIFQTYKKYFPHKKRVYCFLDEIHLIPQWERWIRTKYDQEEDIKFIITGSSAYLLSRELSTLLTGRNLTFDIRPLSFEECKQFNKEESLEEYMLYGGFPEVVLEKNKEEKEKKLQQYFTDIIHRDIINRHKIRNAQQIISLSKYLVSNTGNKVSINKLAKVFGLAKDTIILYISYMVDAYLLVEVRFFSFSAKTKYDVMKLPKYYVIDNGLVHISDVRYSKNTGQMFENTVFIKLLEKRKKLETIMYWSSLHSEVDFVLGKEAINVTATNEIPEREERGLEEFQKKQKQKFDTFLITPSAKEKRTLGIEEFLHQSL